MPSDQPENLKRVARLSAHWAKQDPQAAARWVESLADGDMRHWAELNVANQWSRIDSDAAKAWRARLGIPE